MIARKEETVDATIESHIYQVRLKDSLLLSLLLYSEKPGMPKRTGSMSGNIEYLQLLFYFSGIILTFYILTQAEDLKDLNDKENVAFRKELAPLLEPLEPKDVRDKWKLLL